jgi:hypothetical protein
MEHEINELFKLSLLRRPQGRGGVAKKLLKSHEPVLDRRSASSHPPCVYGIIVQGRAILPIKTRSWSSKIRVVLIKMVGRAAQMRDRRTGDLPSNTLSDDP